MYVVRLLHSYAFKDASLVNVPAMHAKMSLELREIYQVDPLVLVAVFIAALIGTFVASLIIFAITFRNAVVRSRQARRLRYTKDRAVVTLGPLPQLRSYIQGEKLQYGETPEVQIPHAGPFHVFLSHNWKHGQEAMRIIKNRLKEMLPDVFAFLE